ERPTCWIDPRSGCGGERVGVTDGARSGPSWQQGTMGVKAARITPTGWTAMDVPVRLVDLPAMYPVAALGNHPHCHGGNAGRSVHGPLPRYLGGGERERR